MDSIRFSEPNSQNLSEIIVQGLENPQLTVTTKKVSALNFFEKFKIWASEILFGKSFVRLNAEDGPRLIKIEDLTHKLGLSSTELQTAETEGALEGMIKLAVEAKNYHIPFSTILAHKDEGTLEELRYLEFMADSLHLPLHELITAKQQGNIQEFIKDAQEVENKCYETFKKLDDLYQETNGIIVTKGEDERIKTRMTPQELQNIKDVIRSAYKILAQHPNGPKEKHEKVISISKDYHILVEDSDETYKITGLFGNLLGHGGTGVVVKSLDLLSGSWSKSAESVLKIPKISDPDSIQLLHEVNLIEKINPNGSVIGLQKPLKVVRDVFKGTAAHCHMGPEYQTDLGKVFEIPGTQMSLKPEDKISLAYQLIHGVYHIHQMKITNGDIKPQNVFCDLQSEDERGPLLFLADFGGAVDHTAPILTLPESTTALYRQNRDENVSFQAHMDNNRDLYFEIESKADVFATSSVICSIFTGLMPTILNEESRDLIKDPNLQQQLTDAGLSLETARILIKGLDVDYTKRPDAETLLTAIRDEFTTIAPERSKLLFEPAT